LKVKLTPLNLVSAACLVASVMLFSNKTQSHGPQQIDISGMLAWFGLLVAVVFFISDQIFRRIITNLGKLWLIESILIIFIIILIFIIKASIS